MEALIKTFWNICWLRSGPQDVPASRGLFLLTLGLNILFDLGFVLTEANFFQALVVVAANTAVMLGAVYLLLLVMGYGARALQTLTAMQGTDLILGLYMLPLVALSHWLADSAQGPLGLMVLLIYLWSVVISTHILRNALSIHWLPAGLLAIGYFILSVQVLNALLPANTAGQ